MAGQPDISAKVAPTAAADKGFVISLTTLRCFAVNDGMHLRDAKVAGPQPIRCVSAKNSTAASSAVAGTVMIQAAMMVMKCDLRTSLR